MSLLDKDGILLLQERGYVAQPGGEGTKEAPALMTPPQTTPPAGHSVPLDDIALMARRTFGPLALAVALATVAEVTGFATRDVLLMQPAMLAKILRRRGLDNEPCGQIIMAHLMRHLDPRAARPL